MQRHAASGDLPRPGAHIHLIGVAGAGMRGLGLLLTEAGYQVSGCDRVGTLNLPELAAVGASLAVGHDPSHVERAALVIHTSALPADHPELLAAQRLGIPVLKRARALAALLNHRRLAAVAGTHGKTSITALAGLACTAAGLDPAVAVGGHVPMWSGFARVGAGDVAIVEADEYDRSFLELDPQLVLISSIEAEHLDTYGSVQDLEQAYRELALRALDRDGLVYCADDPGARRIGERLGGASYGFATEADYRVEVLHRAGRSQLCRLFAPGGELQFGLDVPGDHNAQNAAGALAVALRLVGPAGVGEGLPGVPPPHEAEVLSTSMLSTAFARFGGVDRRLQLLADEAGTAVLDDYAHHPTEVAASLAALRSAYPNRRLVVVFQPHLYSRTQMFAAELAEALATADDALVLPIYPAREEPIPGVDSGLISTAAAGKVRLATKEEGLAAAGSLRSPSVVVFMGAGDVTELAHRAAEERIGAVGG